MTHRAELRLGRSGQVRGASPEATALLRTRRRELVAQNLFACVFPEKKREDELAAFRRLIASGPGSRATRQAPLRNGQLLRWDWSVEGTAEKIRVRVCIAPAVRADERVHERNHLATLGMLAKAIAHEIISPLSGVNACIRSLRDDSLSTAERDAYFAVVLDSMARMESIARQALDFGRRPAPKLRRSAIDIVRVIDDCTLLLRTRLQKKSIRIERSHEAPARIHGDRSHMVQALMNILTNAIDAAPEGTIIRISTARRREYVEISVRDEGPGIPRASLAKIGVPFFTTKSPGLGTGLGISITRDIVAAHRGRLLFRSRAGEGTTVTMALPAAPRGNRAAASR